MAGMMSPIPGLRTILIHHHHTLPVRTGMIATVNTDALHPEAPHIVAEMSKCVTGMILVGVQNGTTPGQGGVGGVIEDISVADLVVVMVGDDHPYGHYVG